jgi:phosphate transport system ATP-binding protein
MNATVPKLQVQNLNIHFGAKQVLKSVNLNVPDKQITALIGPSGSGKSVLLRSINRMHDLEPSAHIEGSITLDGVDIYARQQDVVDVRKKIGMVFQRPNPFPKSIFDNVAFGLRLKGERSKEKLTRVVEECLRGSYLWDEVCEDLSRSALRLSGGQQQRLCIARTVAVEPEVILMDEPCSALDPISTGKVEDLMLKLKDRFCIVIVTHSMQQAQRVSDTTAFMYIGELLEFGKTSDVFSNPQHDLTRQYISGSFG